MITKSKLKSFMLASCLFLTPAFNYAFLPYIPEHVDKVKAQDIASGHPELFQAIYDRNIEKVRQLITAGANLEDKMALISEGPGSSHKVFITPLVAAVATGNIDVVRLLLEKGAHVNTRGGMVQVPLIVAAAKGVPEVVSLLLQQPGINVNATQNRELTWDEYEDRGYHNEPTDIMLPLSAREVAIDNAWRLGADRHKKISNLLR